jgi:hypothetical protein
MDKIHNTLCEKSSLYKNWHETHGHKILHLLILVSIISLSFFNIFLTSTRIISAQEGGYVSVDPEKYNISVGLNAGNSNINGVENTIVGDSAGRSLDTGSYNTMIGRGAGNSLTSGNNSVLAGYSAGLKLTTGANNTMIGTNAGASATSGFSLTLIGLNAGMSINTGASVVAVGSQSGASLTGPTANGNVMVGPFSGQFCDNASNTFVGYKSGMCGNGPTVFQPYQNVVVGSNAGQYLTTAQNNVILGTLAGNSISSGNYNIVVGYNAFGQNIGADGALKSTITIGTGAKPTANNQMVVGGPDSEGLITDAYFGSGVSSVSTGAFTLHATGGSGSNKSGSSLQLAGGQSTGSSKGGSINFLVSPSGTSGSGANPLIQAMTIDGNGNVNIGSSQSKGSLQVNGYIQLGLTRGTPPTEDCDQEIERGRMKVDSGAQTLYICMNKGWVKK